MFISFDGVDGAGKSTQITAFVAWLREQGREVVACRDPGSTALGDQLRAIVLNDTQTPIDRRCEMLLYMAARAQLVEEVVKPALAEGKTVVSDRYLLANVVYQGWAGGLDPQQIWSVGAIATDGVSPDITLVLDIDPAAAANRFDRELDRMESQGQAYLQQVRAGFLAEAERNSTMRVINADRTIEQVQSDIRETVIPYLHR